MEISDLSLFPKDFSDNEINGAGKKKAAKDIASGLLPDIISGKGGKKVEINPTKFKPAIRANKKDDKKYDFKIGERRGDTRIVDERAISSRQKKVLSGSEYRAFINSRLNTNQNSNPNLEAPDGMFTSSSQGKRGDCYLLAEINAIRNSKHGQEILRKNVKANPDGSITVTLPGAIMLKNKYQGPGCEITGTYRITREALDKARSLAGISYSSGDIEVIAIEIAMENFRAELLQTKKNLNLSGGRLTAEGQDIAEDDILSGGHSYDAGFLLTGQKSEAYQRPRSAGEQLNLRPYKDGEYGYITREEMERGVKASTTSSMLSAKSPTSEISHFTDKEQDIDRMLDKYAGHEKDYAITFSVRVAKAGPDGKTLAGGGHALTIVKITGDTVYAVNPWHPDKIEPIPRRDFIKMCKGLTVQKMDMNEISQNHSSGRLPDEHHSIAGVGGHVTGRGRKPKISQDVINIFFGKVQSGQRRPADRRQSDISPSDMNRFIRRFNSHNSNNRKLNLSEENMSQLFQKLSSGRQNAEMKDAAERLAEILQNSKTNNLSQADMDFISSLMQKLEIS